MKQFLKHIFSPIGLLIFCCVLLPACRSGKNLTASQNKQERLSTVHLTEEQQRQFNNLYLSAVCQKLKAQYDAQYDLLSAALDINPDAPEALIDMALLTDQIGGAFDSVSTKRADSLLQRAVDLAPYNKFYKNILAERLQSQGKIKQATKYYEEIAAIEPTEEILKNLINAYVDLQEYQKALDALHRLEDLVGKNEVSTVIKFNIYQDLHDDVNAYRTIEDFCAENPNDLKYRVLLGDLYMQYNHAEQALLVYKDVLTAEPDNPYAQLSLLAYYYKMKQDSLYQDEAKKVALNPRTQNDARLETMRGYIKVSLQKGDSIAPYHLFKKVLHLPDVDRSMCDLCLDYLNLIHFSNDSLQEPIQLIVNAQPEMVLPRLQLILIASAHEQKDKIKQLAQEGINFHPEQMIFYYYKAISTDNTKEAIKILEDGLQQAKMTNDAMLNASFYELLGTLLYQEHHTQEAFKAFEKAVDYNAKDLELLNNYAYFLSCQKQDLDKAEVFSRITIDESPESPYYLDTYAWILYLQKKYNKARRYIQQAIELNNDESLNATLCDHAGDIFFRCKQAQSAIKYWKKALQSSSDKNQRKKLLRKIRLRRP